MTKTCTFKLSVEAGGNFDDHWDKLLPEHVQFWQEASLRLSSQNYSFEDTSINVSINWTPLARAYKKYLALNIAAHKSIEKAKKIRWPGVCHLSAIVTLSSADKINLSQSFLELFLYEVFAIANIACPGTTNFTSLSIKGDNIRSQQGLALDAALFELSRIDSLDGKWPQTRQLPLNDVINWYHQLQIGLNQKAIFPTQRAIFSIFHLCRIDRITINSVIWLFSGLESLLNTKNGENISGLIGRSALLLRADQAQKKELGKKIRKLYDLRCAFVHGNYEIHHPLMNDVVDRRLEKDYGVIMNAMDFGTRLYIALIQEMVVQKIHLLSFEEKLVSVPSISIKTRP